MAGVEIGRSVLLEKDAAGSIIESAVPDVVEKRPSCLARTSISDMDGEHHLMKGALYNKLEPHSPALSAVSTHCGGAGSPSLFPQMPRRTTTMTTRSLSNMSQLELCPSPTAGLQTAQKSGSPRLRGGGRDLIEEEVQRIRAARRSYTGSFHTMNKPVEGGTMLEKRLSKASTECTEDAPVHRPKAKGEAQPLSQCGTQTTCVKTQKILDEAHHFGLCEHYSKLLDQAKEVGFHNVKWPTNFTLFHLAAKKSNREFIEWLVRNDFDDLHTIDDFGKKPIDYACPKKRDSCYDTLNEMMKCVPPPETDAEQKYQAIKNGTYVDPLKKPKEKQRVNAMAAILQSADIAQGDCPAAKPGDLMTPYEAETMVPAEYKKCFKQMANGGWSAMEGKWPNQGQTVLHWAARNDKEELCHFLIVEYGADPHQEDGNGHDAMYHAKLKRHRKLAKKLLLKFKDPKTTTKGKKK